jgi:urea transport system permease protein
MNFSSPSILFQQGPLTQAEKPFLIAVSVLALFLGLYPAWVDSYSLSLLRDVLILSVFALSLDFLWGKTGLLCFGHSVFFGIGAYTMSLLMLKSNLSSGLCLIAALGASSGVAAIVGYFLIFAGVRRQYFVIVTLALAMIGQQIVISFSDLTGGDAGLIDIPPLNVTFAGSEFVFADLSYYYLGLIMALVVMLGLWLATRGNYGKILKSILFNEYRAQTLGHNTSLHLLSAFTLSALLAGLSGAIFIVPQGIITPDSIGPVLATEVIVWVAVGGRGTLLGPMIGCFLVVRMRQEISSVSNTLWPLILGVFFVLMVFVFPDGIITIFRRLGINRLFRRDSKEGSRL